MVRKMTKKLGKILYRDGPAIIATALFAVLFVTEVAETSS